LPQFDYVFAYIAKLTSNCQFVFLRHDGLQRITELFERRLDRAFAALGLKASDHCLFLEPLSPDKFVAAIGQCDVFLDSIGWSGCNSLLESLAHNLPIVTTPGPLMRGRHGAAVLQMMGVTDTIADTVEKYISIAARLANQPDERLTLSRTIAERKHRLYRDRACISALEEFLNRAARQQEV
jgi:predicted O-linked N-acetylglucosamine transferase (SPINDLY family)